MQIEEAYKDPRIRETARDQKRSPFKQGGWRPSTRSSKGREKVSSEGSMAKLVELSEKLPGGSSRSGSLSVGRVHKV